MPLINGVKMACEPCIRGHRSTKCNHASERLMVPVRKPGRPLSACPHTQTQSCNCGSVTAAILRKQSCHCGGAAASTPPLPQVDTPTTTEIPSPTKVTFKVQKMPRPTTSRKSSISAGSLERMDMKSISIVSMNTWLQNAPQGGANGYQMPNISANLPQSDRRVLQKVPSPSVQPSPLINISVGDGSQENGHHDLTAVPQKTLFNSTKSKMTSDGTCCCTSATNKAQSTDNITPKLNLNCEPEDNAHSYESSGSTGKREVKESCCSSNGVEIQKQEPVPGITSNMTTLIHQSAPSVMPTYHPQYLPPYLPQPTIYAYPPSYGSYQNPLQPAEWRHGVRALTYNQLQGFNPHPSNSYGEPLVSETLDTIHSCGCGETCQCIGCAAHPYNDATQDYVRSAWSSMMTASPTDQYSNEVAMTNGYSGEAKTTKALESSQSPTAQTPSSTTSGNGEEQSLSATDFFFVNYPFAGDGCGGDTQSCPCGDDCECLGCTIHRGPAAQELKLSCAGTEAICPCGDDCQCIGCTVHKSPSTET